MGAHRKYSASAAYRWLECAGSVGLESQCPESQSEAAAEGTQAHAVAEKALRDPNFIIPEAWEPVTIYVNFIRGLMANGGPLNLRIEFQSDLIPGVLGGTADAVLQRRDTLHVVDLKYGQGVRVDAIGNDQLLIYAGCALPFYPAAKQACLTIVQPRTSDPIRQWRLSRARLEQRVAEIKSRVAHIESGFAETRTGNHCRWCRAKLICPEFTGAMRSIAATRDPVDMLGLLPSIRAACDELESQSIDRIRKGEIIPGWSVVPKAARAKWADGAENLLAGNADLFERKLIGITEAGKILGKEALAQYVIKESNGWKLERQKDVGFEKIEQ